MLLIMQTRRHCYFISQLCNWPRLITVTWLSSSNRSRQYQHEAEKLRSNENCFFFYSSHQQQRFSREGARQQRWKAPPRQNVDEPKPSTASSTFMWPCLKRHWWAMVCWCLEISRVRSWTTSFCIIHQQHEHQSIFQWTVQYIIVVYYIIGTSSIYIYIKKWGANETQNW